MGMNLIDTVFFAEKPFFPLLIKGERAPRKWPSLILGIRWFTKKNKNQSPPKKNSSGLNQHKNPKPLKE